MGISEQEFLLLKQNMALANAPLVTVAKAPVVRSGYRSKVEERYAQYLDLVQKVGGIRGWKYEAVRLRLAQGVTYVPDFVVRIDDSTVVFREVKGRKAEGYWTMPVS